MPLTLLCRRFLVSGTFSILPQDFLPITSVSDWKGSDELETGRCLLENNQIVTWEEKQFCLEVSLFQDFPV